ncbi:ParA family protein [Haliovirga abyssi]|uniref:Sporulation initiation inhibitor Soj n=1 Tax=Haliovirga abyssi TaxID=2996794 RepID=A0AAU9DBL1_9FUSO|nr:ParA family protein [Haliovirga abyssi]BDU49637.1 sporulation initiation inhibitor Soj [Haliovirga abyssi]
MKEIIVFSNRKGGTGKSSSVYNLGYFLSEKNKVLLIDFDSQGHLGVWAGLKQSKVKEKNIYISLVKFIKNKTIDKDDVFKIKENLYILPSNQDLSALDMELMNVENNKTVLKDFIIEIEEDYDYIIIDTEPAFGMTALNGYVAATQLIIPIKTDYLSMIGVSQLMSLYYKVKSTMNPSIEFVGILPTFYNKRTNLAKNLMKELIETFGKDKIFSPIRKDIKLSEAPYYGKSIFEFAKKSHGEQDYRKFGEEYLKKAGEKNGIR